MVYYNENDAFAADWLRTLIKNKLIPDGYVDDRSITTVRAHEIKDFKQCHFFAGVGGWPYALQLAGWPQDEPVFTGSCPCQPFSKGNPKAAGKADARHLWPTWFNLIRECEPPTVFGEQVPQAIKWGWWDEVKGDLEGESYACGASVLPASIFGASHERERLYWVADAERAGRKRRTKKTFRHHNCAGERQAWQSAYSGLAIPGA